MLGPELLAKRGRGFSDIYDMASRKLRLHESKAKNKIDDEEHFNGAGTNEGIGMNRTLGTVVPVPSSGRKKPTISYHKLVLKRT
jgi:hypothetical protein